MPELPEIGALYRHVSKGDVARIVERTFTHEGEHLARVGLQLLEGPYEGKKLTQSGPDFYITWAPWIGPPPGDLDALDRWLDA